jgi:ABC-type glycerol-3-phosphate transport system substrate-binding protein
MKRKFIAVYIVLALMLVGCAGMQKPEQSFSDMTPKQKVTIMMGIYNAQYDDYKLKVAIPNLTEEEKQVLRTKKQVLTQVYPLIQSYDLIQAAGGTPTAEAEANIMQLLSNLESLVIREVTK